jgi:hypothetical protein
MRFFKAPAHNSGFFTDMGKIGSSCCRSFGNEDTRDMRAWNRLPASSNPNQGGQRRRVRRDDIVGNTFLTSSAVPTSGVNRKEPKVASCAPPQTWASSPNGLLDDSNLSAGM